MKNDSSSSKPLSSAKELTLYKKAFALAMAIFEVTKRFRLKKNTLSQARLCLACGYIMANQHRELTASCAQIGRMIGGMFSKVESFLLSDG